MDFSTPVLLVSRCLGFAPCRWDGNVIPSALVEQLKPHVKFVVRCPEVEIGLGVPRPPVRVIELDGRRELYQPDTDRLLTNEMTAYARKTLDELPEIDGALLKGRSPSCGLFDVKLYDGRMGKSTPQRTAGFFGDEVLRRWGLLAVEDEGRLNNFTIRERFFIKAFALADFRRVKRSRRIAQVVDFQQRHKLMLMACHQTEMRHLGRLVAAARRDDFDGLCRDYEEGLQRALQHGPRPGGAINVLMHAFGYFKRELHAREKAQFLDLLESYRRKRLPLSAPVAVVRVWIERFDQEYLRSQTFFRPYPEDLISISDSGQGRDY